MELTARQGEVLAFLRRHLEQTGLPPTRAEIADALGFKSANAAETHLRALARKGAIRLVPGASRGICLNTTSTRLPCLKRFDDEAPCQETESALQGLQRNVFNPEADCLVQYRGHPLRSLAILDGDWLAVNGALEPVDEQLVLVRLGTECMVKRFKRKGSRAYLVSDAPDSAAFVVSAREGLSIEGVIVGVLRRMSAPPSNDAK